MEESVLAKVEQTKGNRSVSERVNELLQCALAQERRDALEQEASRFYSEARQYNRLEEDAFQKASQRSLTRE
jgi:hypothetical protein